MLRVRVIKSEKCAKCRFYIKVLTSKKLDHVLYDADEPQNQKELDKWGIIHMPVVQIFEDETGEVVYQFQPGQIKPLSITNILDRYKRGVKK